MLSGLCICWILLLVIYSKTSNCSDFGATVTLTSVHSLKQFTAQALLYNFGFINVIMLLVIMFICLVSFVWIFKPENVYEIYGFILCILSLLPIAMSFVGFL
jgi:hypothetical protein